MTTSPEARSRAVLIAADRFDAPGSSGPAIAEALALHGEMLGRLGAEAGGHLVPIEAALRTNLTALAEMGQGNEGGAE